MKITLKAIIKFSEIIDKLNLVEQLNEDSDLDKNDENYQEDLQKYYGKIMFSFFAKMYNAEEQIYQLISILKNITVKEAENIDTDEIKDLINKIFESNLIGMVKDKLDLKKNN